jgi:hypothetical protein
MYNALEPRALQDWHLNPAFAWWAEMSSLLQLRIGTCAVQGANAGAAPPLTAQHRRCARCPSCFTATPNK